MRKTSIGFWLQLGCPEIARQVTPMYNWACVDLEHGKDCNLHDMLEAIHHNCLPVVRVAENTRRDIAHALDAGAKAIIVPRVNTKEEAEAAVAWAAYPQKGTRGYGFCRANEYGRTFSEYKDISKYIQIYLQIEHKDAIHNLEEIEATGCDGTFIGPYDLSGSYGDSGNFELPEYKAAIEKYLRVCKKEKGIHIVHPNSINVSEAKQLGYNLLALGTDAIALDTGARSFIQ